MNPQPGAIIRGSGGLRKIRVPIPARGKRGGARVIYYWIAHRNLILLLFAYSKQDPADLTATQVAMLARIRRGGE